MGRCGENTVQKVGGDVGNLVNAVGVQQLGNDSKIRRLADPNRGYIGTASRRKDWAVLLQEIN